MNAKNFIHLHVHSEYSLLDGAVRIKDLIAKAVEFDMPAVALTDHGAMYGIIEFYNAAKKAGIKPLLGCEVYIAPNGRFEKQAKKNNEDDYFYTGLENNLNEDQKAEILDKTKEIIMSP